MVRSRLDGLTLIESMPSPARKRAISGIVRRRLAADADMAAVALRAGDRQPQHLQHARIALVEIEGDDLGIAIDAERELGQVVRADREPVEHLRRRRRPG